MADEKLHGEPVQANTSTGEKQIEATARVSVKIYFELDLSDYGGPIIPMGKPPARLIDRVSRVMVEGPDALNKPPSNPQPNNVFGKLIPPPSAEEEKPK